MPQGNLISHHIFLFPFKWNSEKSIKDLRSLLEQSWTRQTGFTLNSASNYNEYNYFVFYMNNRFKNQHYEQPISTNCNA